MSLNVDTALGTLTALKARLRITVTTYDTLLEGAIATASKLIENFCGRKFGYDPAIVDRVIGSGTTELILRRPPVWSIASIYLDDALVAATDYECLSEDEKHGGVVVNPSGWGYTGMMGGEGAARDAVIDHEQRSFKVTYAGGFKLPGQAEGTHASVVMYIGTSVTGADLAGQFFALTDARGQSVTFEIAIATTSPAVQTPATAGRWQINLYSNDTNQTIATVIAAAINAAHNAGRLRTTAGTVASGSTPIPNYGCTVTQDDDGVDGMTTIVDATSGIFHGDFHAAQAGVDNGTDVDDLPANIEEACYRAAAYFFAQQAVDPTVQSESLLSYSVSYGNPTSAVGPSGLPVVVEAMLAGDRFLNQA